MSVPALPVVWRPRLGRLVPHAMIPVVAGCLAALGSAIAPHRTVGADEMVFFGVLGLVALALLYLAGRPRLTAHERGITVVNVFRRRELEWAEVVAVTMPEGEPWATLDLADGTTLASMAIQSADGDRSRRHLADLRGLIDVWGTAPP